MPDLPSVRVSDHARQRWIQRTGEMTHPSNAWEQTDPIISDEFSGNGRLHAETDTILVEKNGCITTVLHATPVEYDTVAESVWHRYRDRPGSSAPNA